jgi:hypothetical protein
MFSLVKELLYLFNNFQDSSIIVTSSLRMKITKEYNESNDKIKHIIKRNNNEEDFTVSPSAIFIYFFCLYCFDF